MKTAKAMERGFENDRRYMLVDKTNKFISQRTHAKITRICPVIIDGQMEVSFQDRCLQFLLDSQTEERIKVSLFEHTLDATLMDRLINSWFSEVLEEEVRLVKMTTQDVRVKELKNDLNQTEVSFADGYPYLIAGTRSLDTLNEKLDNPVPMDRFRPNIVVETEVAHAEDSWGALRVGSSLMHVIKPCARCPVVTVDQESGVKSKEPLKTLANYRKKENKVFFGANAICSKEGKISIGDEVVCL